MIHIYLFACGCRLCKEKSICIGVCSEIYIEHFPFKNRPQCDSTIRIFHYIHSHRFGLKRALNANLVRYSALYVMNVSIVTIVVIHTSTENTVTSASMYHNGRGIYCETYTTRDQQNSSKMKRMVCVQVHGASFFDIISHSFIWYKREK